MLKGLTLEELFPYSRINLNPGTLGSPSIAVRQAISDFYADDLMAFPLGQYQSGRKILQQIRQLVSSTWGPSEETVAITNSGTSTIINSIATALYPSLGASRKLKLLISRHEHYGATYGFQHHLGYEICFVEDGQLTDPQRFIKCVEDQKPDIILLSQITYDLGLSIPTTGLALAIRDLPRRPLFFVDVAQSLGLLPDLPRVGDETGIDAVFGSCHKWLLGPQGTGLVLMTPSLASLLKPHFCSSYPLDENASLSFLETGGGQDFSRLAGLESAIRLYRQVGPDKVLQRSRKLTHYFHSKIESVLERTGLETAFFGPCGKLKSAMKTCTDDYFGILVIQFRDWDAYPLYDFLNQLSIHTKVQVKEAKPGEAQSFWRIGFPYYEKFSRLDQVIEEIRIFFERKARVYSAYEV